MPRIAIIISMLFFAELHIPGLVEVPANSSYGNRMAILYTGDGGWKTTDRGVANILANHGVPVVGLNTLRYFWTRRTHQEAADDFARILARYLREWKKEKVVVIGYSFGADVLPFILSRIPKPLQEHVELLVLLAPTRTVDFEFHLEQWFSERAPKTSRPVLPEFQKLKEMKVLSFCGTQDGDSICRDLPAGTEKILIPGASHRFDKYYRVIAQDILKELRIP